MPGAMETLFCGLILVCTLPTATAIGSYASSFDAPVFTDGALGGQDGWLQPSPDIRVADTSTNGRLILTGGGCVHIVTRHAADVYGERLLIVDIDQIPGTAPLNIWLMELQDTGGRALSSWRGSGVNARCGDDGGVAEVPGGIDVLTRLRAVVDLDRRVTDYYYDKGEGMTLLAGDQRNTGRTATYFVIDSGGGIRITPGYACFDNLIITVPEPATLIFLAASAVYLRRRHTTPPRTTSRSVAGSGTW